MLEKFENLERLRFIPTHLLDTQCFACGKNNPEGLKMKFYTDDEKYVFSKVNIEENKRGWEQVVHGGIISTVLDEMMAWTGIYFTKKFMLTKNISIKYLSPLYINSTVNAAGWIYEKKSDREIVLKAQIYNQNNKLCSEAEGHFAMFTKKLAQRLNIMSKETIHKFDTFMETC
ncbi:MAG: PaaI family thioesterase [Victivallales bacterium]|nr:PaaI family thioesterase [Victivallales bacterium]MCF7889152.1 PaaI family thioesterase [Victivallales bacterium]